MGPYKNALTAPLRWSHWSGDGGDFYKTSFERPKSLPDAAQVSLNLTGFGEGNAFLNGIQLTYFSLQYGECFAPPGGVNPHGSCDTYIWDRCDKPTQDCYHI